jgi:hypothetical protein
MVSSTVTQVNLALSLCGTIMPCLSGQVPRRVRTAPTVVTVASTTLHLLSTPGSTFSPVRLPSHAIPSPLRRFVSSRGSVPVRGPGCRVASKSTALGSSRLVAAGQLRWHQTLPRQTRSSSAASGVALFGFLRPIASMSSCALLRAVKPISTSGPRACVWYGPSRGAAPNKRLKLAGARGGRIALPRRPPLFGRLRRLAPAGIASAAEARSVRRQAWHSGL